MKKTYSMELAGRTLSVDVGRVAAQANGAALMHYLQQLHLRNHVRELISSR